LNEEITLFGSTGSTAAHSRLASSTIKYM